jgi:hypothetical protein
MSKENDSSEAKQLFFNNEQFQLLKQCQQEIFEATEVSPSLRKMINALVNTENLQQLKDKFINLWRNA